MGWKLKNELTVNANVECDITSPHLDVRKVGLDVNAIYDCFHHAVCIEIETDSRDRQLGVLRHRMPHRRG